MIDYILAVIGIAVPLFIVLMVVIFIIYLISGAFK